MTAPRRSAMWIGPAGTLHPCLGLSLHRIGFTARIDVRDACAPEYRGTPPANAELSLLAVRERFTALDSARLRKPFPHLGKPMELTDPAVSSTVRLTTWLMLSPAVRSHHLKMRPALESRQSEAHLRRAFVRAAGRDPDDVHLAGSYFEGEVDTLQPHFSAMQRLRANKVSPSPTWNQQ